MRSRAYVLADFIENEVMNIEGDFMYEDDNDTAHEERTVDVVDVNGNTTTFRIIIIEVEREDA